MGLRSSISPKLLSLQIRKHKNGFSTFPSHEGRGTPSTLEVVGTDYYEFRALLMVRSAEGLTKTYKCLDY